MRFHLAIACLLLLLGSATFARGDDAQALFDSLYGPKVKAAQQSQDRSDDVAVAKELLQGAALVAEQPKLLALICEASYDLGKSDAAGYPTAVEAMQLLATHIPARMEDALDRIGDLYQRQFGTARGDERNNIGAALIDTLEQQATLKIKAKAHADAAAQLRRALNIARLIKSDRHDAIKDALDALSERQRLQVRIDKLAAVVEAKPGDQAAVSELVLLYITELDEPGEAGSFLLLSQDETLKKRVQLADDAIADVTEADAKDLGEWYRTLADQTTGTLAKRKMLTRSSLYLKHYLSLHSGSDLNSAKAQLMLNALTPALEKLGGPAAVSIPSTSSAASGTGASPATIHGKTGPLDLSKIKPVAWLTADKTNGLQLAEVVAGAFGREAVSGRRAIVMNDASLHIMIDDKIAHDLPAKRDERWFVRFIALERIDGFAGVTYDGHGGAYPPNGDGTSTHTPMAPIGDGNQWTAIDIELPDAKFTNRQPGGSDFTIVIRPNIKPFHIERIELYRVSLPPVAQRTIKPGAEVDLLKLIEPRLDAVMGEWEMTKTGLRCKPLPFARIGVPVLIRGSYDMQVKFTRLGGSESVNIMLPVAQRHAACIMDGYERKGSASGLETIAGKLAIDNPTAVAGGKLTTGKLHTADTRVRAKGANVEVEVDLDGQSLIRWSGSMFQFTGSAWRLQDTLRPGFGGFNTAIEVRSATLKLLDGEAELLTSVKP